MKRIITLVLILTTYVLSAQTSCENALPFCASGVSGVTFPATTSITAAQVGPNYGCLGSTPNPAWYYLQISTSGNLDILIQGQIASPIGPGQDVDFICWGPFSSLAGICNSLTSGNTVDCSYSGSFTETLNIPNGITGEYYMVLITNYANVQQNIIFTQYAGTGSTNCSLLSSNSKICAGINATVVATNSGSLTNPTYSINPSNLTNNTGSFVVTPSVTTDYTVYITGLNNLNIPITQTAVSTVSVYPQPSVAPTVTNTTCTSTVNTFSLGLTFYPAIPAPGYTVTWASLPNGIQTPTQTSLSGPTPAGPYTATITAAGGCSTTASFALDPVPDPAIIALSPINLNHVITCYQPTITVTSLVATNNYTWSNGLIAPLTGTLAEFTSTATGNWTINAVNPVSGCTSIKTLTVGINVTTPTSVLSPTFQTINCNVGSIATVTSTATPSINVSHQILSPQGGTFTAQSHTIAYTPGGIGTFTHCVVNDVNGCSSCNNFTVSSTMGFPTYTVTSPQNFTLGCNSKSLAIVSIDGGATTLPAGGAVSYSIIGPPTSTATPSGILSGISVYTVTVPGTWTVITKDNVSFCETRTPISILSNTFAPDISAIVPRQILDCYVSKITLKGQSLTNNVSYLWNFSGTPGSLQGDTITSNSLPLSPTNTLVQTYTLIITNNSSTCKSNSVIPIYQNLFPPRAVISGGSSSLTCLTHTIVLTNQSSTTIPPLIGFPYQLPVIGFLWDGPSPQTQGQVQTTYVGATTGIYTLTAKDLNNGCITKTTTTIYDNRIYPSLNKPIVRAPFALECGKDTVSIRPFIDDNPTAFVYTWSTPPGAATQTYSGGYISTNMVGQYKVLSYNPKNGCASSAQVSVINGTLDARLEVLPAKGFAPLEVKFYNNSVSNSGPSNINAHWNFANGTSSVTDVSNLSPTTIYNSPGSYLVTMYVTKGSCMDTASARIYVDIPSSLEIPNVFTPNGDNVNDLFFLKSSNLSKISMLIYDRWGHIIFNSDSETGNIEWNGKYQSGKDAAEGVYFYILKATGRDGSEYDKKGSVSLFR
ncbi:gliding motility-associated C-terminal domain-containing protein [Aurantibacillus circumpalustris]|uniref:T9SS type B sorting domain-containing protein n=1 Tax=Aurantibacillus circumpalustris TaxID=3036359 RepID=UPI00295BE06B|nr:gliding motility-associated C-terminal domain-containing protein [Aurantibacillus circumpalustris]